MSEVAILPTIIVAIQSGNQITLKSYYNSGLPNIFTTILSDISGSVNGQAIQEGELLIIMKSHPELIDANINGNGELIVTSGSEDIGSYYIDENGDLIYDPT